MSPSKPRIYPARGDSKQLCAGGANLTTLVVVYAAPTDLSRRFETALRGRREPHNVAGGLRRIHRFV
jgi:hypothetical protein